MFAFGLFVHGSGEMFLARDRLGIKPLYYTRDAGELRFASALPALVRVGPASREIDAVALHHYMSFHSVVPAPPTLLRSVRKLPPATWLRVAADGTETEARYWSLRFGADEADPQGPEDWAGPCWIPCALPFVAGSLATCRSVCCCPEGLIPV